MYLQLETQMYHFLDNVMLKWTILNRLSYSPVNIPETQGYFYYLKKGDVYISCYSM